MLKIFNTLTKKKEIFIPINHDEIKLYVCGVTVYDLCHLGHGRTFIVFDTIVRYLRHCGYQVKYVRNITDIDDKIISKAAQNNESIHQLTTRMIKSMYLDLDALNVLRPDHEPKVTNYINTIIDLIKLLIKKKHAYIALNGDVIFSINTYCNYGVLSNRKIINVTNKNSKNSNNSIKQNSTDFVLWKASKPGEPYWMSPWGKGRPGWHIECSAMSYEILGEKIDIHGGGSDLIFPHHDNEIAQFSCAFDTARIKVWMHTGLLSLNNEKMSKSLNNFFTIREILKKYDAETVRYFLLSAHYRNVLQFNEDHLQSARISLEHLYTALRGIDPVINLTYGKYFISSFMEKMNDDFNTPEAYSVLFELAHELNIIKNRDYALAQIMAFTLKYLSNILGLLYQNPETYLKYSLLKDNYISINIEHITSLIKIREIARKNNQWDIADKIRQKLFGMGIILEDQLSGKTRWRYRRRVTFI